MLISVPEPMFTTFPSAASADATATKPRAVSSTNVKSRRVSSVPSLSVIPVKAWLMIVGITARADWRGPYALNGRTMAIGRPKDRWKLSPSASAAILVAQYGDCACNGCSSSIGTRTAEP